MDDLEADYFSELLPFEQWQEYDSRHTIMENEITIIANFLADYYFNDYEEN